MDISKEIKNFVLPGVQHKYQQTLLIYTSIECEDICPWCFRQRLFDDNKYSQDTVADLDKTIEYISNNKQVSCLHFTGGEPFDNWETTKTFINEFSKIEHIKEIRLGTRAALKHPYLLEQLDSNIPLSIMLHTIHPEDLSDNLLKVVSSLKGRHQFFSQTPLLKNKNNDPEILKELWEKQISNFINPYYLFHCRTIDANKEHHISLGEGFEVYSKALQNSRGSIKRVRYVMSTDNGKLEFIAQDGSDIILKYHQARNPEDYGKLIKVPAENYWL